MPRHRGELSALISDLLEALGGEQDHDAAGASPGAAQALQPAPDPALA